MFNRDKVIETLIDDDLNSSFMREYLTEMLTDGFKGYGNFTDQELMKECDERDISYLFGEDDDETQRRDEKNGLYPEQWDIAN